jgi:hypothetical protein
MPSCRRALVPALAAVLALPALATPAAAAPGDTPVPAVRSIDAFCVNAPDPGFTDVQATDTFAQAIRCLAFAGVALGGPAGLPQTSFGPGQTVKRGPMASFIARTIDAADARDRGNRVRALPRDDAPPRFTDVPANDVHANNIQRLAAAGIVSGGVGPRPATTFSPELDVTRAQMATFINKAIAYLRGQDPAGAGTSTGLVAPTGADYYTDDEDIAIHRPNIQGITSEGISIGVGGSVYGSASSVTRGQMTGFLARTLALLNGDLRSGAPEGRIHTLLELFTSRLADADRNDATLRPTTANPENVANPVDNRTFNLNGLRAGVEYRITVVKADTVRRAEGTPGQALFTVDNMATPTARGNLLTATGGPTADITSVNGAAPQNNTGRGTTLAATTPGMTPSAVAVPRPDGTLTFTIDGDTAPEEVRVVVYVNGGPAGRGNGDGGESPRLEIDAQGRPLEPFALTGLTSFRTT